MSIVTQQQQQDQQHVQQEKDKKSTETKKRKNISGKYKEEGKAIAVTHCNDGHSANKSSTNGNIFSLFFV